MAGKDNLIPTNQRSKAEVREIGRKGGIASGKARQQKARLRRAAEQLMDMPIASKKNKDILLGMGFTEDELTNEKMLLFGLFQAATIKGNVEAFKEFRKLLGEDEAPTNETLDKLDDVLDRIEGNI